MAPLQGQEMLWPSASPPSSSPSGLTLQRGRIAASAQSATQQAPGIDLPIHIWETSAEATQGHPLSLSITVRDKKKQDPEDGRAAAAETRPVQGHTAGKKCSWGQSPGCWGPFLHVQFLGNIKVFGKEEGVTVHGDTATLPPPTPLK